ncbi:MAG: hypothetical protein PVJ52_02810, partial [Candidatus Woesebacteria bacterium]
AFASWIIDSQGRLLYKPDESVLGKKDSPGSDKGKSSEAPGKNKESGNENTTSTQTEDSNAKGNKPPKAKRVKIERSNNKLKLSVEDENGEDVDLPDELEETDEVEIEDPEDANTTTVKPLKNSYTVIRNKVAAKTNFPLMVNLETNELIVTTPKGSKVVTVLPDKAVENMLAANVIDHLGGKGGLLWEQYQEELRESTQSTEPTETEEPEPTDEPEEPEETTESAEEPEGTEYEIFAEPGEQSEIEKVVNLTTTDDGTLSYEIEGIKDEKLLGFFRVRLRRTAIVSAETGELLRIRQTFGTKVLDALSF